MRTRSTIFRRPLLKWIILLASWASSILLLIIFAANNELSTLYNEPIGHLPESKSPGNQIGALSYTRCDSKENSRPVYSVHFKNLRADNNKFGIFKTGLHKVVKIQDLQLRFYRYTPKVTSITRLNNSKSPKTTAGGSSKLCTTTITDISPDPEDITTDVRALVGIVDKLTHLKNGWRVDIDLSNVSKVRVNNFDYKVFYDGDLSFDVQSKRIIASDKQSEVVLRGHVTIKTADGSTLESNCVKWDIKNQHFTVNGVYVLNRNGVRTTGKGICVDAQLNVLKEEHVRSERKEKKRCLAKLWF